jgi:hypothetical protein
MFYLYVISYRKVSKRICGQKKVVKSAKNGYLHWKHMQKTGLRKSVTVDPRSALTTRWPPKKLNTQSQNLFRSNGLTNWVPMWSHIGKRFAMTSHRIALRFSRQIRDLAIDWPDSGLRDCSFIKRYIYVYWDDQMWSRQLVAKKKWSLRGKSINTYKYSVKLYKKQYSESR